MDKDIVRTTESLCLNCGRPVNAVGTGNDSIEAKPESGDIAVCFRCGAVMMLDDKLKLRGMTAQEMDELKADRETMNELAKLVQKVHFVKHINN